VLHQRFFILVAFQKDEHFIGFAILLAFTFALALALASLFSFVLFVLFLFHFTLVLVHAYYGSAPF